MNKKDILDINRKDKVDCAWENNVNYISSSIALDSVIILSAVIMIFNFFIGKADNSVYSIFWFLFFVKFVISYKYKHSKVKMIAIVCSFITFTYYFVFYIGLNLKLF